MVTSLKQNKLLLYLGAALLLAVAWFLPDTGLLNPYVVQILMYVGINMILTLSLNLVNGYMGEFSVGHAGFMGIGAYAASILTVWVLPRAWAFWTFPAVLVAGGLAAAVAGLVVAFPSFRTRGDYLAIVTLAFNMIVKSVLENIPALGGPRGRLGNPDPVDFAQPDLFQFRAGDHGHPRRRSGRQPDLGGYPAPQALRLPH